MSCTMTTGLHQAVIPKMAKGNLALPNSGMNRPLYEKSKLYIPNPSP